MDGALYGDVVEMFKENALYPAVTICLPHNFGNLSKRTLDNNLKRHWAEGPEKINVSFVTSHINDNVFETNSSIKFLGPRSSYNKN